VRSSKKQTSSPILERYFYRVTLAYAGAGILFASLVLSTFYLRSLLVLGIEKSIPASMLLRIFAFTQISQFGLVFPIAIFMAIILAMTNFAAMGELNAMRAAGMSHWQLARPYVRMAWLGTALMLFWHNYAIPWARGNFRETRSFIERYAPLDFAADTTRTFTLKGDGGVKRQVHFGGKSFNPQLGTHVFQDVEIIELGDGLTEKIFRRVVFSHSAFLVSKLVENGQGASYLRLQNGYAMDFSRNSGYDWNIVYFSNGTYDIRLFGHSENTDVEERAKDSLYFSEVVQRRNRFEATGDLSETRNYAHEMHQRTALPASIPTLIFLAFTLGTVSAANSRWTAIAVGVLLVGGFYAAFMFARVLAVDSGTLPAWLAAWVPNFLMLAMAAGLNLHGRRRIV
jgi:lipopolysaccharide export system permease protein